MATSTECVIASTEGIPVAVSRAATLPIGRSAPSLPGSSFLSALSPPAASLPRTAADWQADRITSATLCRCRLAPSLLADTKSGCPSSVSKIK